MKKINLLVLCGLLCAAKPALAQTSAPAPGVVITSIVNPFSCVGGPYNGTINVRVADNFTNFPYEIVLYDELFNLVSSHLAGFNFEERDFFVPPGRYWIKLQKDGQQIPEAIPVPVTVADPGIEVSVLNVSYTTAEKSTGSIELAARSSGNGIFYYSIDNRTTWQTSNVFQNLSAGTYQITVKNDFGCESTVQVEVRVKNLIEIQPQNMIYNQSYDRYGNIRAFYVYAEPTNSANTLSYQWYKWNSIYYWEEIQGATSAYYDPVDINIQNYNLTPEGKYYCRVTETGTDNVEYSDEVCLTVMRLCPSLASIGHYYINLDFGAGTLAETISWNCIQGIYGRTSNIFYSIFELHLPINGLQITVHYPGNRTAIYSDFDGISHDPQLHVAYSYSYLCYKDVPAVVLFDDIRGNGNDYHNRWYRWSIEGVVGMGRIPIESWGDRPWDYTGNLNPVTIPSNIILDILTAGGNRFWLVLEYDNGNGCRYEARAEITIINPIIEQQPDLEVCSGEEVKIPPFIINTDFPSSLNWYVDDPVFSAGGTSGSGNIPSFMAPQNQGDSDKVGKFTVVNQILANCYDFMQFNVKVKPVAFPLIHQRDIVICQNKSDFNLSEIVTAAPVAPGAMLKWYDEQKQPVPVNPPAVTPLINTSIAGTQTYYVTQALNGTCESPVEEGMITVRIKPQATWNSFKVLYDANTCPAAGMMIEAVSDLTNPVYRWYDSQNTNVLLHTGSIYESFPSPYYEDVHYIRVTVESDELCEGVGGEGHDGKISVRDIIAPTGSCPADITVDADESGTSSKVEYELNYADNCSEVSYKLIEGLASGEVFPAGKTRVVYDISDKSKNTVRCEFWVTVVTQCETPAPPIIAERDIVLCRNASGFTLSAQGNNLFWYDEQMQYLSQPPKINPTVAGTYTYYVTQSDGSCESPVEEGMITVRIKPQATWNSFKVLYDANTCPGAGMMIEAVSELTNPVYRWYDSQNPNVLLHTGSTYESFPSPYYEDVHYIRVTVESDELCEGVGGEGHDGKISVRDIKAPIGSCPADITVNADESGTSAKVEYELNYADNCSEVSYKLIEGLASGEVFPAGKTRVVYDISDKAKNTVRCEFWVTVLTKCETPAPPVIAERDIVLCRNAPGFTLSAQGNNLFWYDEQMQLLSQPPQISPTVAGTYTYYVTQSDGSCESPKEEGMITVRIKPQATWNSFKVLYDANTCPAAGMMIEAVSDLTNPVYRWYDSQNTNVLLHTGSTYESFPGPYYEDVHYIRVTVESDELCEGVGGEGHDGKIIVRDNKAPTGSCPADITVDADESGTSAKVEYELNYADNCSEVSYKLIAGLVSGEAFPVGETSVVYEVSDKAGNTVRCEFTVTVIVVKLPGDLCTTCSDITAYGSVPQHGFKWELCSNGTLTIGGTGTIQNFSQWVSANHIASITRVVICPGIIAIGNNAFKDFFNMTSVSIPETVTSIGNRAFSGCRGLTSLTIPASVVHIENFAFEGCKGLKEIINHSPVPQTINPNQDAFRYVDRNTCTLIVPKGSENAYRFAPGWIGFKMGNAGNASLEGTVTGIDTASDSIWVHLYIQSSLMKSSGNEDLILVASVLVGPGGQYSFENLPAGVYIVKLVFNEDNEYKSPPSDPVQLTGGATGGTVNFTVNAGTQTVTPGKPTLSGLTGTEDVFAFDLKIYPNPFTDAVRIIFTDAVETWHAASLHIINAAGIIVHTQTIASPDETIQLGHLPAGMYIFRIEKDGKVKTFKIIKIQ